jgi:pimeloyl-ACP methyl ester carboxylesterase
VLLGHSWGSALGLLYAHRSPGTVRGCIGVAQVADQAAQERASYAFALAEARRRRHARAIRELEAIGEPPFDVPALGVKNRWVEAFGGTFAPGFDKFGMVVGALLRGETSIGEIRHIIAANEFSLAAMWREVRTLDVPALVPEVAVPVAFMLGRQDRQCPPDLAAGYFGRLRAPGKTLRWFERSAHNIPFEQPAEFDAEVAELVGRWI